MKTISRLLASLVLVATSGVASAQAAAKDFYVEAGLVPMKISEDGVAVTPVVARLTFGKNINSNLAIEVKAFTPLRHLKTACRSTTST